MTPNSGTFHQSTLRRTEMVLPGMVGLIVLLVLGIYGLTQYVVDGNALLVAIFSLLGGFLLVTLLLVIAAFRVNAWTIEAGGIRISERPKVPFFGLHRRVLAPFRQIRALAWVESGFDLILEITTAQGRRHRMMRNPLVKDPPGATLEDFAEAIRASAKHAGIVLPATSVGLSWWNTMAGIGFIAALFALSCALAGVVGWALLEGTTTGRGRGPQAAAIALLLPFGAGYLLFKTIRRRRRVMAKLQR